MTKPKGIGVIPPEVSRRIVNQIVLRILEIKSHELNDLMEFRSFVERDGRRIWLESAPMMVFEQKLP